MSSQDNLSALVARIPAQLPTPAIPHATAAVAALLHAVNIERGLRLVATAAASTSGSSSGLPPWKEDAYTLTYGTDGKPDSTLRVRVGQMGGRIQVDVMFNVSINLSLLALPMPSGEQSGVNLGSSSLGFSASLDVVGCTA